MSDEQPQFNEVDLDAGTVTVAEFTQTDAALAELKERYAEVPDVDTEEGYQAAKAAIKELTSYRTKLEAKRKEIKQPFLDAGRIIDAEAKRITGELQALESPIKQAKQEADEREKRMREERERRCREKIRVEITKRALEAKGHDSATIAATIEQIDQVDCDDFYPLQNEAARARDTALEELGDAYSQALEHERLEAERAEAEKERQRAEHEAAVKNEIATLKALPTDYMDATAAEIDNAIAWVENYTIDPEWFGEHTEEAQAKVVRARDQLIRLREQAQANETARRADEQLAGGEQAGEPAIPEEGQPMEGEDAGGDEGGYDESAPFDERREASGMKRWEDEPGEPDTGVEVFHENTPAFVSEVLSDAQFHAIRHLMPDDTDEALMRLKTDESGVEYEVLVTFQRCGEKQ